MDPSLYLVFLTAVFILVATPGPSVMLGVSHSLQFGWRRVMATAAGDVTANVLQMGLALIGFGAVLAASTTAFSLLKAAGVAYLVYLGIKTFRAPPPRLSTVALEPAAHRSSASLFWQGFGVAATNPKAIAFYAAFFPQFIDPTQPVLQQFALLATTCVVVDYVGVVAYAWLAQQGGRALDRSGRLVWINRIAGCALVLAAGLVVLIRQDGLPAKP